MAGTPNANLTALSGAGVSIWLDTLSRELLHSGAFGGLIRDCRVTGATSNPTIFAKAITGSDRYDEQLSALAADWSGAGGSGCVPDGVARGGFLPGNDAGLVGCGGRGGGGGAHGMELRSLRSRGHASAGSGCWRSRQPAALAWGHAVHPRIPDQVGEAAYGLNWALGA